MSPAAWASKRPETFEDSNVPPGPVRHAVPPVRLEPSGRAAPCQGIPGTHVGSCPLGRADIANVRAMGMPGHARWLVTSPNFGQAVDLEVAEEVEDNRLRNLLHRSPYQLRAKIKKRPTRATTNILP
ncbi:hypothetical protein ACJIZ3_011519 [Penstemon smallii]|uniref:Uncharacterized protein n=1 Tax=Penstemon smallii TaxID=265156 RepID=A0ABD3UMV8_9LAMI